jgi:hypothetical protein
MPTELDYARLAAFIDGEGCILVYDRKASPKDIDKHWKRTTQLLVCVRNTDPRLPMWCREKFGGSIGRSYPEPPRRNSFLWRLPYQKAGKVLQACLPFFLLKREQAIVAIAIQETMNKKYGRRGVPENIRAKRDALMAELKRLKHVPLQDFYKSN